MIYVTATEKYQDLRQKAKTDVSGHFAAVLNTMEPRDRELVLTALEKLDQALTKCGET